MQTRYVALLIILALGVGAYYLWPARTVPLVSLPESADPVEKSDKILNALRDGLNVEVRTPSKSGSASKRGSKRIGKRKVTKIVSFGHPPPSVKKRLDRRLRRELKSSEVKLDRVRKLVEAGDASKLEEMHDVSAELALWTAMLDILIHDQALLTSGPLGRDSLRDHYTPRSTINKVQVDKETGNAIDRGSFDQARPASELLTFESLVVTYPIPKADYPDIALHRSERDRAKNENLMSKVISFNSLNPMQRKARYEYNQRLMAALKKGEKWEGKDLYLPTVLALQASKGVPQGLRVFPKRDYVAKVYGRR